MNRQSDFIGRVAAIEKVELRARVSGFLGKPVFSDGDRVKAGQVLFEIDPATYQANVDQREAQLMGAKAALENASLALGRSQQLVRTDSVSRATVDKMVADQAAAEANVKSAEAMLAEAKINLSYTQMKSPIDGRVGRASVTQGNLVGADSGVLATVVRDDEVRVLFPVTQREILEARRDGSIGGKIKVRLKLADQSVYEHPGAIDFLDVTVDSRTDGQIVRATFPNPGKLLNDGQTVRVSLERDAEARVVAVPQAALATDQSGQFVFVVTPANMVDQRRVKAGVQRDGFIAIEDGLKADEMVVVQGQQRIRPGIKVTPQRLPASR